MASRLSAYRPGGAAPSGSVLRAAGFDLLAAAVAGVLLWPFPLVRLTLGVPWAVHGPLIAVWILLVYVVYLAAGAGVWGRTPVMYLLDLGLAGAERPFGARRSLLWAAGWALAVVPALAGARSLADPDRGLAARFSGLREVAVAAEE